MNACLGADVNSPKPHDKMKFAARSMVVSIVHVASHSESDTEDKAYN